MAMDLSTVPIHQRLDALLNRLDENEDDFDYQEFVDRRSKFIHSDDEQQPNIEDEAGNALDDCLEYVAEDAANNSEDDITRAVNSDGRNSPKTTGTSEVQRAMEPRTPKEQWSRPSQTADSTQARKPVRRDRQIQLEVERTARLNQEQERAHAEDITAHTVKTRTVDSFLADLSDNEEIKENTQKADERRFQELVSSPPQMQGLRSFISQPVPPPHLQGRDEGDSDSELEVIPETKTNRLSKPVKTLLKFSGGGGGTSSDRKLAMEKSKLLNLQLQQITDRKKARIQDLKAQGVDVEEVSEELNAKRRQNVMSAEALYEQERMRNEALRKEEYDGSDYSDSEDQPVERSRKMFSDSEDDDSECLEFTKTERDLAPQDDTEDENDAGYPARIGRTGTQYVPPLDKKDLAKILGISSDEESEDSMEPAQSDTQVAHTTGITSHEDSQESWNIVQPENDIGTPVHPDLSGLKNKDLTLSQHLAEVRHRYQDAQAEQRRKDQQARRKRLEKSNFLEDQAEESDDEENGGLGRFNSEGDDEPINSDEDLDVDLQGLVDHGDVKLKEAELRRRYLEDEKLRDQRMVNRLVEGVHGGFRRRIQGENGRFLDNDDEYEDDAAEEQMQQYLKSIEARRKTKLAANTAGAEKLSSSTKGAAFLTSVSEDLISRPGRNQDSSVQESLVFLRSVAKDNEPPVQHDVEPPVMDFQEPDELHELPELPAFRQATEQDSELPKVALSVRRSSTLRSTRPPNRTERGSTYASRISASDLNGARTVEIYHSLGKRAEPKKSKKRFVAPTPTVSRAKQPRRSVPAAVNANKTLFKRSWS